MADRDATVPFSQLSDAMAAPFDSGATWIERKAKLFEAGDYPDKGVKVGPDDLQRLADGFEKPVPVLIEHAKSPLEIGYLTGVQADGDELFGTLSLTKEANDLIEASGAHALSLGLGADLATIKEVSLVARPRVPSARLFTGRVLDAETDWKAAYEKLREELDSQTLGARIDALVAQGRALPAQVPFAKALAACGAAVAFDGESVPIGRLALAILENGPSHRLFGELAPVGTSAPGIGSDERAFYDRYFAGLSLEDIARNRAHPNP